ncbi:hypothetical protein NHX12_004916 [Muraenolepis orangiensis]|uniref:Uncharacterized protein n=1 Tax=Muraenolepis orangiensis TaxID=630683 RepID=A0A9Q0DWE9_9TELE|nr:hypothetical protein NHX12_004916 [Muraenolepis orangiensis]
MSDDVIVPSHQTWLPHRYQSIGDLRTCEKVELQADTLDSGERDRGFERSFPLSRSQSLDHLPRRESVGTSALRDLFESKSLLRLDYGQKTQRLTQRDSLSPSRQASATGHTRGTPSASVRDRLALYLSRVAATDTTGGPAPPESIGTSEPRHKASKVRYTTLYLR